MLFCICVCFFHSLFCIANENSIRLMAIHKMQKCSTGFIVLTAMWWQDEWFERVWWHIVLYLLNGRLELLAFKFPFILYIEMRSCALKVWMNTSQCCYCCGGWLLRFGVDWDWLSGLWNHWTHTEGFIFDWYFYFATIRAISWNTWE